MPRLIFANRFFFPDHSATSQILSDLAFHLSGAGNEVHVVTSTQIYDDPKALLPDHEIINDVHVHRVSSTQFGRSALLGRAIDYLSFYRSVRRRLIEIARHGDVLEVSTGRRLIMAVSIQHALLYCRQIFLEGHVRLNFCADGKKVDAMSNQA